MFHKIVFHKIVQPKEQEKKEQEGGFCLKRATYDFLHHPNFLLSTDEKSVPSFSLTMLLYNVALDLILVIHVRSSLTIYDLKSKYSFINFTFFMKWKPFQPVEYLDCR